MDIKCNLTHLVVGEHDFFNYKTTGHLWHSLKLNCHRHVSWVICVIDPFLKYMCIKYKFSDNEWTVNSVESDNCMHSSTFIRFSWNLRWLSLKRGFGPKSWYHRGWIQFQRFYPRLLAYFRVYCIAGFHWRQSYTSSYLYSHIKPYTLLQTACICMHGSTVLNGICQCSKIPIFC